MINFIVGLVVGANMGFLLAGLLKPASTREEE